MRTDRVELIEHRQDVLNICGIWVRVIKGIEERAVFRTKLFLQFICPLAQRLNFFRVFLLGSLIDLHTETVQLAVGLALRFIALDAADNFLVIRLQLGRVWLLGLCVRRRNKQRPNYQQPVHKFLVWFFRFNCDSDANGRRWEGASEPS